MTSESDVSARRSKMTAPWRSGNVASSRESRNRLILVVAAERQQTCTAQAIDFGQIKPDAGFVYSGDSTIEMCEAVRRPAGGQQHFGGQAKIILRKRTDRRCIADLGIDQSRGVRDA